MSDIEKALRHCELSQHLSKFTSAGVKSLVDVKKKVSLIKALLPRVRDYKAFMLAVDGNTPCDSRGIPQPPYDPVLGELQDAVNELTTEMRKSSVGRADSMIGASKFSKSTCAVHHFDSRTARIRVLKASGKLEQNKAMLSIAYSGLTTHRRFLELSRSRQAQHNRGGNPASIFALDEELDTLRSYVQDVLVNLGEQRRQRSVAFEDSNDGQESEDAAKVETLRTLLKEKENDIFTLNEEMDSEFASMQTESIRFADEKERLEAAVMGHYTRQKDLEQELMSTKQFASLAEMQVACYDQRYAQLFDAFNVMSGVREDEKTAKDTVRENEIRLLQVTNHSLLQEVSSLKAQVEILIAEKATAEVAVERRDTAMLADHNTLMERLNIAHEVALNNKQDEVKKRNAKHEEKLETLQKDFDEAQVQVTLLQLELDSKTADKKELTKTVQTLTLDLGQVQEEFATCSAQLNCDRTTVAIQTLSPRTAERQAQPDWLRKIHQPADLPDDLSALPPSFVELAMVLEEKGFDPLFAARHAQRLSSVECIATNAAETLPLASREKSSALEISDTIQTQVRLIVDRHGSQVVSLPVPPSRLNEKEEEGTELGPIPCGLPLVDFTFISSWRNLEGVVGHQMPRNGDQESELPANQLPLSLNDEVMANLFETMRVVRGLRSELFCSQRKDGGDNDDQPPPSALSSTLSPSRPQKENDDYGRKTPIEINGRRRQ